MAEKFKPEPKEKSVGEEVKLDFDSDEEDNAFENNEDRVLTKETNLGNHGFLRTYITLKDNNTIIEWFGVSKTKQNLLVDISWQMYNLKFEGDNIGTEEEPRVSLKLRPLDKILLGRVQAVDLDQSIDFKVAADWKIAEADVEYLKKLSKDQNKNVKKKLKGYTQFLDDDFPPTNNSLDSSPDADLTKPIEFKPLKDLFHANPAVFSGEPKHSEIVARVENYYFDSGLALLTEIPEAINRVFVTKIHNKRGQFILRVCFDGTWRAVFLDSFFPANIKTKKLVYCRGKDDLLWPTLMEKCYSKVLGEYSKISKTTAFDVVRDFTGLPVKKFSLVIEKDKERLRQSLLNTKFSPPKEEKLFFAVFEHDKNMNLKTGLTTNRAYPVLDYKEVNERGFVQLRNPCDPEFKWNGDWSVNSKLWAENSNVTKELGKDFSEGKFWMSFENFSTIFNKFGEVNLEKLNEAQNLIGFKKSSEPGAAPAAQNVLFKTPEGTSKMILVLSQPWEIVRKTLKMVDFGALLLDSKKQTLLGTLLPSKGRWTTKEFDVEPESEYLLIPFSSGALERKYEGKEDENEPENAGNNFYLSLNCTVFSNGEETIKTSLEESDSFLLWSWFSEAVKNYIENPFNINVTKEEGDNLAFCVYKIRMGCWNLAALELREQLIGQNVKFSIDASKTKGLIPAPDSFVKNEKKVFEMGVEKKDFSVIAKFVESLPDGYSFCVAVERMQ